MENTEIQKYMTFCYLILEFPLLVFYIFNWDMQYIGTVDRKQITKTLKLSNRRKNLLFILSVHYLI